MYCVRLPRPPDAVNQRRHEIYVLRQDVRREADEKFCWPDADRGLTVLKSSQLRVSCLPDGQMSAWNEVPYAARRGTGTARLLGYCPSNGRYQFCKNQTYLIFFLATMRPKLCFSNTFGSGQAFSAVLVRLESFKTPCVSHTMIALPDRHICGHAPLQSLRRLGVRR